jgi:hypothetical protein
LSDCRQRCDRTSVDASDDIARSQARHGRGATGKYALHVQPIGIPGIDNNSRSQQLVHVVRRCAAGRALRAAVELSRNASGRIVLLAHAADCIALLRVGLLRITSNRQRLTLYASRQSHPHDGSTRDRAVPPEITKAPRHITVSFAPQNVFGGDPLSARSHL